MDIVGMIKILPKLGNSYGLVGLLLLIIFQGIFYWFQIRRDIGGKKLKREKRINLGINSLEKSYIEEVREGEMEEKRGIMERFELMKREYIRELLREYEQYLLGVGLSYSSRELQVELLGFVGFLGGHFREMRDSYRERVWVWFRQDSILIDVSKITMDLTNFIVGSITNDPLLKVFRMRVMLLFDKLKFQERVMDLISTAKHLHILEEKKRKSTLERLVKESEILQSGGSNGHKK